MRRGLPYVPHLASVGWDGTLYDCDFNQMLSLPVVYGLPRTMTEFEVESLAKRKIATSDRCYACTAGAGLMTEEVARDVARRIFRESAIDFFKLETKLKETT